MNFNQDSSSPIRFTPRKEGGERSSPERVSSRPTGETGTTKDFKKVLAKSEEEDQGQNAKSQGVEEAAAQSAAVLGPVGKKKASPSLFDLTSGKSVAKKSAHTPTAHADKTDSPTNVFAKMSTHTKEEDTTVGEGYAAETYLPPSEEKGKFTTRFATEQTDLSYVNPMIAMANQPIESRVISQPERVEPTINLQAIIDQLVDKVVELKVNDRTETTITLKQPPLFQGANIIVTSFDSAKGEFNISFENLTQQAKNVLDMQVNRESLLDSLEKKGYAVHILTTTTLMESRPIIADAQQSREPNRERREPDQGQQQQQRRQR